MHRKTIATRGLYIWGGVGRGKTWLMDLFCQSISRERVLRLHFHRFMQRIHQELSMLKGCSNPLPIIAKKLKKEIDVLCFDEFFVSDISDAMLLGTLIGELFNQNIIFIATSNLPPSQLYANGLQRARFLPAITQIEAHCDVINLDSGIDYRMKTLVKSDRWLTPLDQRSQTKIVNIFTELTGLQQAQLSSLEINHRVFLVEGCANGVLMVEFNTLCREARSQNDYIELSKLFHTVILLNLPIMNADKEDQARRFLMMIDEFYERRVKLIITAETEREYIYCGEKLRFEYQRCLSRLYEMQSNTYLALAHLG